MGTAMISGTLYQRTAISAQHQALVSMPKIRRATEDEHDDQSTLVSMPGKTSPSGNREGEAVATRTMGAR